MIRVGLIGEDPYDKISIKNLLGRKYDNVHFQPLLKTIKGKGLDCSKTARALAEELKRQEFKLLIFIRDLDGLPSQRDLISKTSIWFDKLKNNDDDILLLNIWELETLIFADIETFNKKFGVVVKAEGDPMMISNPKEQLKHYTYKSKRRFRESDCPEIFSLLDIERIASKCRYFKGFLEDFEKKLSA